MSANVDVETRVTGEDALRVPLQAVLQRVKKDVPEAALVRAGKSVGPAPAPSAKPVDSGASGSGRERSEDRLDLVFVLGEGGKIEARVVTLGPSDGEFVEAIWASIPPSGSSRVPTRRSTRSRRATR